MLSIYDHGERDSEGMSPTSFFPFPQSSYIKNIYLPNGDIPLESETTEIWKDIPGYEGLYEISNFGRVKSKLIRYVNHRILKPHIYVGYQKVGLSKNKVRITKRVSRLVLQSFIGDPPNGFEASHLNGIRNDDRLENLVWESPKENTKRKTEHGTQIRGEGHYKTNLKESDVINIIEMRKKGYKYREISKKYGIGISSVECITNKRNWKHLDYA